MHVDDRSDSPQLLPAGSDTPIQRIMSPFVRFARLEAAGGLVLLFCTVAALLWANSPWADSYDHFWHLELSVGLGPATLHETLIHFINDGLMAIFFFFVGLEIKHELLAGELSTLKRAIFPMAAAVGGAIFPALIFITVTHGTSAHAGWGIPVATDIAFVLGALALLGSRVPVALKVFVTALAIVDDIIAVSIIALFYTTSFSLRSLIAGLVLIAISFLANHLGVRSWAVYAGIGVFVWLAMMNSGVHATVAGILLALTIPARPGLTPGDFLKRSLPILKRFQTIEGSGSEVSHSSEQTSLIFALEHQCELVQSPLYRIEHALQPWVTFLIMPVFALANAGVHIPHGPSTALIQPITMGIFLGLFFGKPLGIFLFGWLSVKSSLASAPEGVSWRQIAGAGCLCGIGFTMSLFISTLSIVDTDLREVAKIGIFLASVAAGVAGSVALSLKDGRDKT
jgi:NhaA family Na+:H+ antiporter